MNGIISYLGGRRFVMTMGCGIACTGLVWFGKIGEASFATIIIATVAAYITGGTTQHIVGRGQRNDVADE